MIDLQGFCADVDKERIWLSSAFSLGEFSYASNGAYAVRVPRRQDVPEIAGIASKAAVVLNKAFEPLADATFESVARVILPDVEENCQEGECDDCDGSGNEHECPSCQCQCPSCGGKGQIARFDKISIEAFGCLYRLPFLRKMLALPGVEIAALPRSHDKPALFRFEGGVAVLNGLNGRYSRHLELVPEPAQS